MKIELPWPDPLLWPNGSRGNTYAVSRLKKAYKHAAEWATIDARQKHGVPAFEGEIPVKLIVYAKPKGPLPDKDNCVSAVKVGLDAIAKQIGVNDRRFAAPIVEFAEPRTGRVEVQLG